MRSLQSAKPRAWAIAAIGTLAFACGEVDVPNDWPSTGSAVSSVSGAGAGETHGASVSSTGADSSSASTTVSSGTGMGTGGAGGAPCGGAAAPDYAGLCTGTSFFPDGSCYDGICATTDLEKKVYAAWKAHALAVSGLTEAELLQRVQIESVAETDGPIYVFVKVRYVDVLDLLRSRQSDNANLGTYPLQSTPSDTQIASAIQFGMEDAEWTGLAAINGVACPADIESAFAACVDGMTVDWCHIDFQNVTGILNVRAGKAIDLMANQCKQARVDVASGSLMSCDDVPCGIN